MIVAFNLREHPDSMANDAATILYEDTDENLRTISLTGRLDIQGTEAVGNKFAILSASDKHRIVVDLTALDFLASIGIRSLVSNAKAQQQRGGRLVLFVGDNAAVAKVLKTTGIDTVIPMFADAAEARKAALA
jgi:anti-sigma B factor antagonist